MMVHSDEKPHPCLQCDKAFRFSWNLNKHVSKCHADEGSNPQEEEIDEFNEIEIF